MDTPARKSSLPTHNPTQLSVISEEASQYGRDVVVSPRSSPVPSLPPLPKDEEEALPARPGAPTPPASVPEADTPQSPATIKSRRPAAPTPAPTTTPTVLKKRSKRRAIIDAIRKHSAEFFESFKAHDFSRHRQEMNDVFALIYGTGATTTKQQKTFAILRIRKLQERGVEWWATVTRAAQHKIDPPTDSLEDLLFAIKRGEDAVLKTQEFDKRLRGRCRGAVYHEAPGDVGKVKEECDWFVCEMHAASAKDFHDAEAECKQLVIEAGGNVSEDYDFIGGFLYSLPITTPNPLANDDETLLGGHITIKRWKPFSSPHHRRSSINESSTLHGTSISSASTKDWPRPTSLSSKRKMQNWILEQRIKTDEATITAETTRTQRETTDNDNDDQEEIVLSPRILDPGVELAILEPGRLLWSSNSRPSSMHVAVQAVSREQEREHPAELQRSWLDISGQNSEIGEAGSIADSDYDEDAVVMEAETAVSARASPVVLRRVSKL